MAESVIGSKEVIVAILSYVLVLVTQSTGVDFPLTPEQILGAGVALMTIIRVFWTSGKIQSLLPKGN